MSEAIGKKIHLRLVGLDGNAFVLLGAFRRQAKKEGWSSEEISAVTNEATRGDYDHLLATLVSNTTDEDEEEEEEEEDLDDDDEIDDDDDIDDDEEEKDDDEEEEEDVEEK